MTNSIESEGGFF